MNDADSSGRDLWQRAETTNELRSLMTRWLRGELQENPWYGAPADPETGSIASELLACNELGFLTTFSQPAEERTLEGFAQRACVSGFADEGTALRIVALGVESDLIVFAYPPYADSTGYRVPITVEDGHPFTWVGFPTSVDEFEQLKDVLPRSALDELLNCWDITLIDPMWGRSEYLWERLRTALQGTATEYSAVPSPGLSREQSFVY